MTDFNCQDCKKSFDTEVALDQHRKDKHGSTDNSKERAKKKLSIKAIAAISGVIIVILAGVVLLLFMKPPSYTIQLGRSNTRGNGSVEIIEFSDFQCPACGAAYPQVEEFLKNNSYKVTYIYKHFPLTSIHKYAQKAAEASECAADQGKFWEYYNKLFQNQQRLAKSDLVNYAEQIGLDTKNFTACLESGVMSGRVSDDFNEGNRKGVRATPTFFINGRKVEGVLSVQQLEQEIMR